MSPSDSKTLGALRKEAEKLEEHARRLRQALGDEVVVLVKVPSRGQPKTLPEEYGTLIIDRGRQIISVLPKGGTKTYTLPLYEFAQGIVSKGAREEACLLRDRINANAAAQLALLGIR